jgi:hypothetical protein
MQILIFGVHILSEGISAHVTNIAIVFLSINMLSVFMRRHLGYFSKLSVRILFYILSGPIVYYFYFVYLGFTR